LAMQVLNDDQRRLLIAFENHGHDLGETAKAMGLPMVDAEKLMKGIRNAATRSRQLVSAEL
jgi:DNA-directed RNA polymerase specialized sigma24 family protein